MTPIQRSLPTPDSHPSGESRESFLAAADRIGRRLDRDALWSGKRCNWVGWCMESFGGPPQVAYRALPPDLYSGVAGVALFLAHLWRATGDANYRRVLSGAVEQLLSSHPKLDPTTARGFYTGLPGIAHALLEIGELTQEGEWIRQGLELLEQPVHGGEETAMLDVVGGWAGSIPALLLAAQRYDRPALFNTARHQGEQLLLKRHQCDAGTSWPSPMAKRNLTGFSHGTAGMAVALLELHHHLRDSRFLDAGKGALRYERNVFDRSRNNWPDFRKDPVNPTAEPSFPVAWCHGATGIGMSRLRVLELQPEDPETLPEIDAAMQTVLRLLTTARNAASTDFTLCHGLLGNADFLLQTADQFQRPDLRSAAEQVMQNGLRTFQEPGLPWPCGVPGGGETPGLLLGTAGIGYFLLRLHDSTRVPSALLLRPSLLTDTPTATTVLAN